MISNIYLSVSDVFSGNYIYLVIGVTSYFLVFQQVDLGLIPQVM